MVRSPHFIWTSEDEVSSFKSSGSNKGQGFFLSNHLVISTNVVVLKSQKQMNILYKIHSFSFLEIFTGHFILDTSEN